MTRRSYDPESPQAVLHTDVASLVADYVAAGIPPLHTMTPEQARALLVAMRKASPAGPDLEHVADAEVSGAHGLVNVRIYAASASPRDTILYLHGGGWVLGSVEGSDAYCRHLCMATGARIVSVDYRLAPEHPFPAGLDDCRAALAWAFDQGFADRAAASRLFVMGDSAGANLAAVLANAQPRGAQSGLSGQILVYPVADCDLERASYRDCAETPVLRAADMTWFWNLYCEDASRRADPATSPLRSPSLPSDLPALILLAEFDPLRDEGAAYALRLAEAGATATLKMYPGTIHGFATQPHRLEPARQAMVDIAAFLAVCRH